MSKYRVVVVKVTTNFYVVCSCILVVLYIYILVAFYVSEQHKVLSDNKACGKSVNDFYK